MGLKGFILLVDEPSNDFLCYKKSYLVVAVYGLFGLLFINISLVISIIIWISL